MAAIGHSDASRLQWLINAQAEADPILEAVAKAIPEEPPEPIERPVARGSGKALPGRCPICKGKPAHPKKIFYASASRTDRAGFNVPSYLREGLCNNQFHRGG